MHKKLFEFRLGFFLVVFVFVSEPCRAQLPTQGTLLSRCITAARGLFASSQDRLMSRDSAILFTAFLALKTGQRPESLHPLVLAELLSYAKKVSPKVSGPRDLQDADIAALLTQSFRKDLGRDDFLEIVGRHFVSGHEVLLVDTQIEAAIPNAQQVHIHGGEIPELRADEIAARARSRDRSDMNRGWGYRLLLDTDPVFWGHKYLTDLARARGLVGPGMEIYDPTHALDGFRREWRAAVGDQIDPIFFTLTGSDANNLLFTIALAHARARTKNPELKQAEILFFSKSWGAGRGPMTRKGFLQSAYDEHYDRHLEIPAPLTPFWVTPDLEFSNHAEIRRLKIAENKAIELIREKLKDPSLGNIGGIFLEPIVGPAGVYFYRTEFLLRLRSLADELQVPIFADEILTGGGRTGRFFAFQHYDGFVPDYLTYGKGLVGAGVAIVRRPLTQEIEPLNSVTLSGHTESLLKATAVMRAVRERGLVNQASSVGEYFLKRLRALAKSRGHSDAEIESQIRGRGMLLYDGLNTVNLSVNSHNRLMPPLSFTKKDVDKFFAENGRSPR